MRSNSVSGGSTAANVPILPVIAGPTASGKTRLGIALAQALGGEIISADARQIYRHMDIGTAKPTPDEQAAARHHMIDVAYPHEAYSAGRFAREAAETIGKIRQRGRLPIVVGGAGFYLDALQRGLSPIPEIPVEIRTHLQEAAGGDLPALYRRLREVDPETAERLHPQDTQRIVRALEVWETAGERLSDLQRRPRQRVGCWRACWIGLTMDRAVLYRRIEDRVDRMLEDGLVEEVQGLQERGYGAWLKPLNTFGYKEIFGVLNGGLSLKTAVEQIKQGTRRYAKRQLTWFRRESEIAWFDPTAPDAEDRVLQRVREALQQGGASGRHAGAP